MLDALVTYMRARGVARVDVTAGAVTRVDLFEQFQEPPHPDTVATHPPPPGSDEADDAPLYPDGRGWAPS